MNGQSLGTVEHGTVFRFTISNRDQNGDAIAGFTPSHFDVLDPETEEGVLLDQALTRTTDYANVFFGSIDFSAAGFATDQDKTFGVVIKAATGEQATFLLYNVTVSGTLGRLDYLRNDIENVVFPRLKRILGLCGENMILDDFVYDNAHNIIGLRMRLFQNSSSAQLATPDLADSDIPEVGEISTYRIDQTMELPRSVRLDHTSFSDSDEADVSANDNQDTDFETAPGNEAGWPV